ncbi:phytanoyl-CoA dioxygenase [Capsulimonas corticalis]|uniref:Phytanoyl-CoA dioxygenase n=1 Tax=Capsulimonas corticalis TaxID=2219043 RepID=A0A402CQZ6_9BACT|nr:phytanoyl-CoA dioxygenase family protein [Capsulimonas corticalis]BDI34377.1 phytanoyl-CoA dioxygenase [Capsulimonas corticalis]
MSAVIKPTLPSLDSDYSLTQEQIQQYQRDGHILLRGVLSPEEVAAYRAVINEGVARLNWETRALDKRDTYGKAFLQIGNLSERAGEDAARFTLARRFAKIAADLMDAGGVRLYHDQALYKEVGGGHTPWHQDHHYWPLDTDQTITMWMPLVDASTAMGTMRFASGSHREGYLGDLPISDQSEETFRKFVVERGYPVVESGEMAAGDATFHSGWTLHGAPGNLTGPTREVMTVIYFADGASVSAPVNDAQENDRHTALGGLAPGELAASASNPLLYTRGE